jgi:hypothetical protein
VNALLLESYDLGLLPAGTYSVVLTRRTLDAAGVEGTTRVVRAGVTVPSSGGVTIDLTVP